MKRFLLAFILLLIPFQSQASFLDSFWFEPTILCVAGGAGGYFAAPKGNEIAYGAIGCAAGGLIGYFVNAHYKNKFTQAQQKEIDDLNRSIQEMQAQQAQQAASGNDDSVSIRIKEIVPGKRLPDGSVTAPTFREKLILPGEGTRIGE